LSTSRLFTVPLFAGLGLLLAVALRGQTFSDAKGTWTITTNGNSISIKFTPKAGAVNCPKIGFVQTVRNVFVDGSGKEMVLKASDFKPTWAYKDDDALSDGTYVDHLFCEKDGFYNGDDVPQDHSSGSPTGQGSSGGGGVTDATMTDSPYQHNDDFPSGKARVRKEFETCAICIQSAAGGDPAGTSYGCIRWTYTRDKGAADNGKVTLTSTKVEARSKSHQDALARFNTNHSSGSLCPEDIPGGTAPGSCANRVYNKKGPLIFHVNDNYTVRTVGAGVKKASARSATDLKVPSDRSFAELKTGDALKACDFVLVPQGAKVCIRRNSDLQAADPDIPFRATFVDLFGGAAETVESAGCLDAEHCGMLVRDCSGTVKLAAVAPVNTGDPEALVMYTAEVDAVSDTVTLRNDPLSSGSLTATDLQAGGETVLLEPGQSLVLDYPGQIDDCGPFPDCNGNGVPDATDIAEGFSLDVNGNGRPDECEIATVPVIFRGTAQGGQVTVTLSGSVSPCTVLITTTPGQSAATVAANLSAAINADSCVNGQGITASASGGTLQLRGFLLRLIDVTVTDPGLEAEVPIAAIPTLSTAGLALMAFLILVAVLVVLRRSAPDR
jgi:hypothetical protein